jgi:hypothetical protein
MGVQYSEPRLVESQKGSPAKFSIKAAWAKALLIWLAIGIICSILVFTVIGGAIFSGLRK